MESAHDFGTVPGDVYSMYIMWTKWTRQCKGGGGVVTPHLTLFTIRQSAQQRVNRVWY